VAKLIPELRTCLIVHGGADSWSSKQGRAISYRELDQVDWVKGS